MKPADWTVLVPDLFWPEPLDADTLGLAHCPTLERCLAQSPCLPTGKEAAATTDADQALLAVFDCPVDTPIAPLRRWGESAGAERLSVDDYWLCVDPVQLRFHHEQIVLADASTLALTTDEAELFIAGLNRDFADLGVFDAPSADRWYLKLSPALLNLAPARFADVPPLSAVAGRRLHGDAVHLQSSLSQAKVRHWQNEIQMWLHAHPVNAQRRAQGLAEVNGVWLWGGGVLPPAPYVANRSAAKTFHAIYSTSDSPVLRGIAAWLSLPAPKTWDWTSLPIKPIAPALLLVEDFISPVRYQDGQAWGAVLSKLDALLAALLAKSTSVELRISGSYGDIMLDTRQRRRWVDWLFWRRTLSLAQQIQALKPRVDHV